MTKSFVLVAGNIGAGKTSLTERLASRLAWQAGYESVADNPYLADFYADMKAWSFHLQVFFLGHRAAQHQALAECSQPAIIDRSIYEDAFIFARALYEMSNMTERDYLAYRRLFDLVAGGLPPPDLLIYLRASPELLLERIRGRGRSIETGITLDYLGLLDRYYEEWLADFAACPVLMIPSDQLDFVHRPEHLDLVVQRILDRLHGKEQLVFPD
ncbi:MAG: deoxynucleoside kinase [Thermoflexales bacterium]|nr:deoxynucleoside kinase [Thermoflexales bacterium]